jgi:hypothetical protein
MDEQITLEFLARRNERLISEIGSLRDEMRVMSAILMRRDVSFEKSDGTIAALLNELHAIHSQISRMNQEARDNSSERR